MTTSEHTMTKEIAEYIVREKFESLPAEVVRLAKRCVVDGTGVMLSRFGGGAGLGVTVHPVTAIEAKLSPSRELSLAFRTGKHQGSAATHTELCAVWVACLAFTTNHWSTSRRPVIVAKCIRT